MFGLSRLYEIRLDRLETRVAVLEQQLRIVQGVEEEYQHSQAQKRAVRERENKAWEAERKRRLDLAQKKWAKTCWLHRCFTKSPRYKAKRPRLFDVLSDDMDKCKWLRERALREQPTE